MNELVNGVKKRVKIATLKATKKCVRALGFVAWGVEPILTPLGWIGNFQKRLELRKEYERNARAASVAISISLTDEEAVKELDKIGKTRVVIIGGGFGGLNVKVALAKCGLDMVDVIIVDEKGWFEYTPGVLRAMVKGEFEEIATEFPDSSPEYIQAKVLEVQENHIIVDCGVLKKKIPFDFLLIASGASYTSGSNSLSKVIKAAPEMTDIDPLFVRKNMIEKARWEIEQASTIMINGGGLVGVELAAEIAERYGPTKTIILMHRHEELCGNLPDSAKSYIQRFMEKNGVELILNARVKEMNSNECTYVLGADTEDTKKITFDLCFECFGMVPNGEFMETNFSDCLTNTGHIRINDFLQVERQDGSHLEHIFAIGDVCSHEPSRRFGGNALYTELQGQIATSNIIAKIQGRLHDALDQFPFTLTGSKYLAPVSTATSLGELDGSLHVENVVINGFLAALVKLVIEETKKLHLAGNPLGKLVWGFGDAAVLFLFREWFQTPTRIIPSIV